MDAATLDILTEKAKFQPDAAAAVAQAIDMALANADHVTVPILDSGFAKVEARLTDIDARMDAGFAAADAKMDAGFAAADAKMDAGFAAADAKVDAGFAAANAEEEARFARVDLRFAQSEAQQQIRFNRLEAAIGSAKVWAALLYAALAITFFGALGGEAAWLLSRQEQSQIRQDQVLAQFQSREDKFFEQVQTREDRMLEQLQALSLTVASIQSSMGPGVRRGNGVR
jgi:hypothetical protein